MYSTGFAKRPEQNIGNLHICFEHIYSICLPIIPGFRINYLIISWRIFKCRPLTRYTKTVMSLAKYFNRPIGSDGKKDTKRVCLLKPIEAEYSEIELNGGVNTLGRTRETGIKDTCCSKRQLELDVNLEAAAVKLRVLGSNPCSVNGLMAMQNTECDLAHGDLIEFVYGRHQYEIVFKPPPSKRSRNTCQSAQKDPEYNDTAPNSSSGWDSVDNGGMIIYADANAKPSEKIAAYDIDGTIITTKSGNVFPKHTEDWKILYPDIPKKLKLLHQNGYKICFFTNQGGIATGKIKLDDFKQKIKNIFKQLDVPVQLFIAVDAVYRKPLPGMWQHMQENKNCNVKIDLAKSFYVGDAAGRPEIGSGATKRRKDHSLADRYFAFNIGLSFYTPEEHFLKKSTEHWVKPAYEPRTVVDNKQLTLLEPNNIKIPADNCELIIMVGLPGSGKSHFCQTHLQNLNYTIANADTLGSIQACIKLCEKSLLSKQSCVVDNTNVDLESRKKFIELAKKYNVTCRCFEMNVTLELVRHNIKFRQLTNKTHSVINEMVFNTMKKRYKPPTLSEGFTTIVKVNLKPQFVTITEQNLYSLYLLEK